MAQQRVHPVTLVKLKELQASINEVREKEGMKNLSVPDLVEEITNYFIQERNKVTGNNILNKNQALWGSTNVYRNNKKAVSKDKNTFNTKTNQKD